MGKTGLHRIQMRSHADMVEGHGVLSAGQEQYRLVKEGLADKFCVEKKLWGAADITHYHTVNLSFFCSIPFAKAHGKTVGYVHFLPETLAGSLKLSKLASAVFNRYLIAFYKSMDALVVVNPGFISKLERYGIPREKISYIPNYVDEELFHPLPKASRRELRQAYGLDPDKFTVVCAGQLQTRKGIFDFADLAKRMPDLQFVWAGGFSFGRMTDGYAEISDLLKDHPDNLFFPGSLPREQMNELYNIGDVMFLPSYDELFPMTILEAMSSGLPLLLRDIDVYPPILFDFYLKENTQEGFEAALRRLQADPVYYEESKDASRKGHAFYSKEHVLSLWDTFYSALIQEEAASYPVPGGSSRHRGKRVTV